MNMLSLVLNNFVLRFINTLNPVSEIKLFETSSLNELALEQIPTGYQYIAKLQQNLTLQYSCRNTPIIDTLVFEVTNSNILSFSICQNRAFVHFEIPSEIYSDTPSNSEVPTILENIPFGELCFAGFELIENVSTAKKFPRFISAPLCHRASFWLPENLKNYTVFTRSVDQLSGSSFDAELLKTLKFTRFPEFYVSDLSNNVDTFSKQNSFMIPQGRTSVFVYFYVNGTRLPHPQVGAQFTSPAALLSSLEVAFDDDQNQLMFGPRRDDGSGYPAQIAVFAQEFRVERANFYAVVADVQVLAGPETAEVVDCAVYSVSGCKNVSYGEGNVSGKVMLDLRPELEASLVQLLSKSQLEIIMNFKVLGYEKYRPRFYNIGPYAARDRAIKLDKHDNTTLETFQATWTLAADVMVPINTMAIQGNKREEYYNVQVQTIRHKLNPSPNLQIRWIDLGHDEGYGVFTGANWTSF